jgi:hypothetical protein
MVGAFAITDAIKSVTVTDRPTDHGVPFRLGDLMFGDVKRIQLNRVNGCFLEFAVGAGGMVIGGVAHFEDTGRNKGHAAGLCSIENLGRGNGAGDHDVRMIAPVTAARQGGGDLNVTGRVRDRIGPR